MRKYLGCIVEIAVRRERRAGTAPRQGEDGFSGLIQEGNPKVILGLDLHRKIKGLLRDRGGLGGTGHGQAEHHDNGEGCPNQASHRCSFVSG